MGMDPGTYGEDYSAVLFSDMTEEPSDTTSCTSEGKLCVYANQILLIQN